MPWVKVDDHFDEHPKLASVGPLGWALWLAGLAYCNRNLTDGFIPWSTAYSLMHLEFLDPGHIGWQIAIAPIDAPEGREGEVEAWPVTTKKLVGMLVAAGIWDEVPRGYKVHDFEDYQPTRAEIEAERAQKVAAGRAGGVAAARARARAGATAEGVAERKPVPVPVPMTDTRTDIQRQTDERFAEDDLPAHASAPTREDFAEVAALVEDLTQQAFAVRNPTGGYGAQLMELVGVYGLDPVLATMRKVADSFDRRCTVKELVFNTDKMLHREVDKKAAAKEERQAEADDTMRRRIERTQLDLHYQHIDGPENHPQCPACREQTA